VISKHHTQLPFFPVKILTSLAITIFLCFLLMSFWWLTKDFTMAVANALAPEIPSEGSASLSIIRHIINLWGAVGVIIVLVYYGLSQAQRRDWRGEY